MSIRLEWKLEDLWVGAYWKILPAERRYGIDFSRELHIWICLLPCLPIHIIRNLK